MAIYWTVMLICEEDVAAKVRELLDSEFTYNCTKTCGIRLFGHRKTTPVQNFSGVQSAGITQSYELNLRKY